MTFRPSLFRSFFLGGFECSTHVRKDGRRLDLIASTHHDLRAEEDYRQVAEHGIRAVRDGVRWHLVQAAGPGQHDWTPVLPLLRAAARTGTQVVWDLCHYGWPDWLDFFSPDFPKHFADYAAAFARLCKAETGEAPTLCPLNEISFLAWAGGETGHFNPCTNGRGPEVKRQAVAATLAGIRAMRQAVPGTRAFAVEPLINTVPRPGVDADIEPAERRNAGMWEAWDMLLGRQDPELGGSEEVLDAIGVNFYWNNQWWLHEGHDAAPLSVFDERWVPLRDLLARVHGRYRRPVFVAETSIEDHRRALWLRYVADEVIGAIQAGTPVEGICLYPVLSHPGWDDDRYCPNGLLEMEVRQGRRVVHAPLAQELRRQQATFAALFAEGAEAAA
ncbi:glycoside hydrolase family 1 protein [Roseicella aerolata]|uniref:Beta-glucosidase n=1 Tax=Roseicella aerolata TaxID=2883479 RepID=A0A9X1L686_9PROT|nr:beta-glucosidase [Roseicella aerolata]MCB4820571.1 beta-glucosidase [Roseicella aerolata]